MAGRSLVGMEVKLSLKSYPKVSKVINLDDFNSKDDVSKEIFRVFKELLESVNAGPFKANDFSEYSIERIS